MSTARPRPRSHRATRRAPPRPHTHSHRPAGRQRSAPPCPGPRSPRATRRAPLSPPARAYTGQPVGIAPPPHALTPVARCTPHHLRSTPTLARPVGARRPLAMLTSARGRAPRRPAARAHAEPHGGAPLRPLHMLTPVHPVGIAPPPPTLTPATRRPPPTLTPGHPTGTAPRPAHAQPRPPGRQRAHPAPTLTPGHTASPRSTSAPAPPAPCTCSYRPPGGHRAAHRPGSHGRTAGSAPPPPPLTPDPPGGYRSASAPRSRRLPGMRLC
ncbi:hypothetical protein FHU30_003591 [Actinomadura rupiterrae]|nr:hypothetical protein [Actinomadura rupiterrae]